MPSTGGHDLQWINNTAVGVQRVPQDDLNVARVLNLSKWKVFTKILFLAVLPCVLTGVRQVAGTAWPISTWQRRLRL